MSEITAPNWLKPLAWAALIWNLLGVIAFVMQLLLTPEAMSEFPIEQQTAYANIPLWSTIAFAIAVFGGTLGCVFLLTKQALAIPTFSLSLGAILLQQYYNFIVINSVKLLGASSVLMPLLVVAIALLLLYISIKGKQAGWLN